MEDFTPESFGVATADLPELPPLQPPSERRRAQGDWRTEDFGLPPDPLMQARDRASRRFGTGGEEAVLEETGHQFTRHALPFVGEYLQHRDFREYESAVERLRRGDATRSDYDTVAMYEQRHQERADIGGSLGGQLLQATQGISQLAPEALVAGGLVRTAGGAIAPLAARTLGPRVATALASGGGTFTGRAAMFAGQQALATPLMPGLYTEQFLAAGGRAEDLPKALGMGYVNNLVLGSLSSRAGGIENYWKRLAARAGWGVGEQAMADVVTSAMGLSTGYGTLGELVRGIGRGDISDALKHALVQGLTFAGFSALHGNERLARETLNDLRAPLQEAARQGKPLREAFAEPEPQGPPEGFVMPEILHYHPYESGFGVIGKETKPAAAPKAEKPANVPQGVHDAFSSTFPGGEWRPRGEFEAKVGGRTVFLGHDAERNMVRIDFEGEKPGVPRELQAGSMDLARAIKDLLPKLKEAGQGIEYRSVDTNRGQFLGSRADFYAKMLEKAGFERVPSEQGIFAWKPKEATRPWEADTVSALRALGTPAAEAKALIKEAKARGLDFKSTEEAIAAINRAGDRRKRGLDPWAPETKPTPPPEPKPEPSPYQRAGMTPLEAKVHELHNKGMSFAKIEKHKDALAANKGESFTADYIYKKAKEKKDAFDAIDQLTDRLHMDALENPDVKIDPKDIAGAEQKMRVIDNLSRRQSKIEEANRILNRVLEEGHHNPKLVAAVVDKIEQALENLERKKGKNTYGKLSRAIEQARKVLGREAPAAQHGVEPGPEPVAGEAPLRRVEPERVQPGAPPTETPPAETTTRPAPGPEPAAPQGGEAPGHELMPGPPPSIQQMAKDIHASGDSRRWQEFKDALERNFPGEAKDQFVQSLGNQKRVPGEKRLGGARIKQAEGSADAFALDQHMIEEAIKHEQAQAAKDPEVHAGFQEGLRAGIEAGEAEEIPAEARNAFQKREAERRRRQAEQAAEGGAGIPAEPGFGEPLSAAERATFPGGPGAGGERSGAGRVTALANEVTRAEREALGLPEIPRGLGKSDQALWLEAEKELKNDPQAGARLVDEILKNPRKVVSDVENMMLLQRRTAVNNERDRAERETVRAFEQGETPARVTELQTRAAELYDLKDKTDQAIKLAGSPLGASLRIRRLLMGEDFSLEGMLQSATAAKGGPLNEKERAKIEDLQRQIGDYQKRIADLEDKITASGKGDADPNVPAWKRELANSPTDIYAQNLAVLREHNKPWLQKALDWWLKYRVAEVISSPLTEAKLITATAARLAIAPLEEAAGALWRRIPGIAKIAAMAPREGRGFNREVEQQAFMDAYRKGFTGALDQIKHGASEADAIYGGKKKVPQTWVDFIFNLHAATKEPAVAAELTRSYLNNKEAALIRGEDVSSPAAQMRLGIAAYKDSLRAKFQNEHWLVDKINKFLTPSANAGLGERLFTTAGKTLLPVVRIPTNIVTEAFQYAFGVPRGLIAAAMAGKNPNLKPAEADHIMRLLKKGSLGLAAIAFAYLNPQMFGGFYSGKRREDELKASEAQIGGARIPSWMMHNPLLETLQFGASVRRSEDSIRRGERQGLGFGVLSGILGQLEEVPLLRQGVETHRMFDPHTRGAFFGELTKSLLVPQVFQWLAGRVDTPVGPSLTEPATRRRPQSIWQHIETGIPGLRQQVPMR